MGRVGQKRQNGADLKSPQSWALPIVGPIAHVFGIFAYHHTCAERGER